MRLIDADAFGMLLADEALAHSGLSQVETYETLQWVMERLDEQPTVDAVPVVRCKDCDDRYKIACPMRNACVIDRKLVYNDWTEDDGFCYCGCREETDGQV